ncbi:bifunctional hydroxymethylpyrimidine kinase/phosphomethylpyrimidine kinase [Phaeovibrio sulfidiphilus]|uniref:hydroxymethylpyrimidine kinase n=1 Tax=Phaeovibrio sulfidiphilus TaxID=1220600 RepID=A0A8J6YNY1_9PROT|nr:bifunctional hydroxymethylpyrimidine kinase/phosphomethylpyrimidine kinase [Phaeovibrio sulfidiphilus]MBE1236866.1 bifunctional hydroxymethylpyrimidine kinase/phosphomethylpyrimidine kinase [Phaeovibrio sulfidiphilus]
MPSNLSAADGAIANVLTIAGTDPTGGAGIQADLKTFSALGCYGMSVVTAVVAQNTRGVQSYRTMEPAFVGDQLASVFEDVRVDAVKIGMVANAEIAAVIANAIKKYKARNVVLDPVMVAKSGDSLLADDAVEAVRTLLVPVSTVITPNLPEAGVLLGIEEPDCLDAMKICAQELLRLGSKWVLLKGGHLDGDESIDLLAGPDDLIGYAAPRVSTRNDHGTGCTLSSAIASLMPYYELPEAVQLAKSYLFSALLHADELNVGDGSGRGPVHHFHALWNPGGDHGHDHGEGCCGGGGHGHGHDHGEGGCCGGGGHGHSHGHDHGGEGCCGGGGGHGHGHDDGEGCCGGGGRHHHDHGHDHAHGGGCCGGHAHGDRGR